MKRPLQNKRPIGPLAEVLNSNGLEHLPDKNPCEVLQGEKELAAEITVATKFFDREHAALVYRTNGIWRHTRFLRGDRRGVPYEVYEQIFDDEIENSEYIYPIHTHPPEGPGKSSNISLGDIATVTGDTGFGSVTAITQVSANEIKVFSFWRVQKTAGLPETEEYSIIFGRTMERLANEEPEAIFDLLDFLQPEFQYCITQLEYEDRIDDMVNIQMDISEVTR
jgi:hypothetical protein